jgi:HSP20 family molecular chaperone IbpA
MTIPFFSYPFQTQNFGTTVASPYGVLQNIVAPAQAYGLTNPYALTNTIGHSQFVPAQGISSQALSMGLTQSAMGNAAQVVAFVPVQQGTQSLLSGIQSQAQLLAVECAESNSEYVVCFDVPGIQAEDLEVSVSGNTLLINCLRKGSQENGVCNYSEIPTGTFTRSVALPFEVTGDKSVNTCLENGVLKIRLGKQNQFEKKASSTRKMKIG